MSDAQLWERICVIDTENASGSLYVGTQIGTVRIGEYLTIPLEPPFSAARYLEAIDLAEQNGVEFLIIDSLSHAWSGEGGLLDVQANIAKRTGNAVCVALDSLYGAWLKAHHPLEYYTTLLSGYADKGDKDRIS